MTTPICNRFAAALAVSALLALTACGGSDEASDAAIPSAATEAGEAATETATTEPAVAAVAIL